MKKKKISENKNNLFAYDVCNSQISINSYIYNEIYKKIKNKNGLLRIKINNVFDWSEFNDDDNGRVDEISINLREQQTRSYLQYLLNSKLITSFSIVAPEIHHSFNEYDDRYILSGNANLEVIVNCKKFKNNYENNTSKYIYIDNRPNKIDITDLEKYIKPKQNLTPEIRKLMNLFLRQPNISITARTILLSTMKDISRAESHTNTQVSAGKKVSKLNSVLRKPYKIKVKNRGVNWVFNL